jgi:hypothetical protein
VIERRTQAAMIVVLKRHESKGLQYAIRLLPHRTKNFGHAVDWPRLRLKGNFHEVALPQGMGQLQQPSGRGNGL